LTDLPEAGIGDEVVLIGKQADEEISLGEIVKVRGTDLREIYQSVRNHIPSIYEKYDVNTPPFMAGMKRHPLNVLENPLR
jgi:hypothetical protein